MIIKIIPLCKIMETIERRRKHASISYDTPNIYITILWIYITIRMDGIVVSNAGTHSFIIKIPQNNATITETDVAGRTFGALSCMDSNPVLPSTSECEFVDWRSYSRTMHACTAIHEHVCRACAWKHNSVDKRTPDLFDYMYCKTTRVIAHDIASPCVAWTVSLQSHKGVLKCIM